MNTSTYHLERAATPAWQIIFWQPVTFPEQPPTMRRIGFRASDWSAGMPVGQSETQYSNLIIYNVGTFGHLNLLTGSCAAAVNIILHIGKSPKLGFSGLWGGKRGGAIESYHCGILVRESVFIPHTVPANPDAKRLSPLKLLLKRDCVVWKFQRHPTILRVWLGWQYETLAMWCSYTVLEITFPKVIKGRNRNTQAWFLKENGFVTRSSDFTILIVITSFYGLKFDTGRTKMGSSGGPGHISGNDPTGTK